MHFCTVGLALAATVATLGANGAAHAELVTLQCGPVGVQGSLTLDFDRERGTVSILNGNPPMTVPAQIDDRALGFINPYVQHPTRIDRRTGGLTSFAAGQWWPGGACQKVEAGKGGSLF